MLIQKLRLQKGWSQEQLAEVSGLSVRTVQRLERGQPGSLETMNALAAVFETDLDRLKEPSMDTTRPDIMQDVRPDEALALAHVRKVKAFYVHLTQYLIVIPILAVINLMGYPQYLWFVWPALGWGLGLLAHGASVFSFVPFLDGAWERRQVEKHLGRKL
ncbi:MAG: XRE family transcriptional regulator [Phenylobacterium sp.]|uniref:2TM domain-containing protein n=1 Tax=Phenylobacterium sp. TaxID=1871053 RepID=UPI0025F91637|nr:2TM domain-containing protein [Phenylobacterium sp.]MBA4010475.1 XRE family transcriptional regulator [Phenylobacterium sp.]